MTPKRGIASTVIAPVETSETTPANTPPKERPPRFNRLPAGERKERRTIFTTDKFWEAVINAATAAAVPGARPSASDYIRRAVIAQLGYDPDAPEAAG